MSKKKAANGSTPPEVPIFLQKTYCMIDTCPPQIATWSSDGLTFLIKNTHLFETTIIPQYFKHSKFSSFVRQLNFYGFRKIRLDNSLKIDLEKEREQRNFWRFRHENFRRGRKDLLREIKRHASSSSSSNNAANTAAAAVSPNAVMSNNSSSLTVNSSPSNTANGAGGATSNNTTSPQEVTRLNTEVNVLKEQMQSMVTKMEDLTDLVKTMKVSPTPPPQVVVGGVSCGNKRKKTNGMMMAPDSVPSMTMMMMGDTDIKMENDVDVNILPFPNDSNMMSLEDAATTLLPDLTLSSNPSSVGPSSLVPTPVLSRCSSLGVVAPTSTTATAADGVGGVGGEEEDFVEELFHAFATGDDVDTTPLQHPQQQVQQKQQQDEVVVEEHPNKPDRQLMKRIEDSLSTIPKTMQEMVANRLIDAIAEGTASISEGEGVATTTVVGSPSSTSSSVPSPNKENTLTRSSSSSSIIPEGTTDTPATATIEEKTSIPLPLAIATLKTILADYGLKVEENTCGSSSEDAMVHRRLSNKSLPLVPMHA